MISRKASTIESYDKTVKDYIKNTNELHPKENSELFLSLLPNNGKILELGCGPGRDAKIFADKSYHVIGVDLSRNMVAAAKKRVKNAKFVVMDLLNLKFKPDLFDGVWANASLLHIPKKEVEKAISEVNRVLKKHGIFYLSVKEGKGEEFTPDSRYGGKMKFWSFFQKREIEKAIRKNGFKIIKSQISKSLRKYATHPWISIFARKS